MPLTKIWRYRNELEKHLYPRSEKPVQQPCGCVYRVWRHRYLLLTLPATLRSSAPSGTQGSVVDHDNSQQSRAFIQMLNATPQLNIVMNLSQESEASTHIADKDIEGVIVIPQHFYRDLLMGKSPVISVGGDASFFLVYGTIVEGAVSSGSTLGAHVKVVKA
nr:ABC transporter permease [Enterovibrio nigricans]